MKQCKSTQSYSFDHCTYSENTNTLLKKTNWLDNSVLFLANKNLCLSGYQANQNHFDCVFTPFSLSVLGWWVEAARALHLFLHS